MKISVSEAHILSSFLASFQCFSLKFGENVARYIIRQKNGVGEFSCFASFKSYDYFSEENACFINSQSLTACQKQTRQIIKISRHSFSKKGVKKT